MSSKFCEIDAYWLRRILGIYCIIVRNSLLLYTFNYSPIT